ncbi:phosphomannomutase/phosphoglucomutase [Kineosporia babensis]|uniref:Phosphomannomutase/phosphoglucomutase n=1 Tax=Kineosporia babensis TaxID=499548 RepID=A0A9X1SXQ3_9ACTN|nr:phosphomannomutase/phosphoglucomutase [Kineosporia babensis]
MAQLTEIVKANDIRGLVGTQLTERTARALGSAFARAVLTSDPDAPPGRVLIGRDMRDSGESLAQAFADGVTGEGAEVVMIGLCSTDGLYYASGALDAPGVMLTASHNPASYNGMKMCRAGARPIGLDSGLAEIRDLAQALLDHPTWGTGEPSAAPGKVSESDTLRGYAEHLRGLVPLTSRRKLKIVVDAGNGMAGLTVPAVLGSALGLDDLPLEIVPLYFELDGTFPNHEANPLDPANLRDLQKAVPEHGADLGLAFDGDADRCFVIDERGEPVSPSAITALVAAREIAKERAAGHQATVIHNLITSRTVPEVIAENDAKAVRTRVGHAFIKVEMAKYDAVFGGEHSAHYYFRDFWFADTGMLAALHVLAALGEQDGPLSGLVEQYERYTPSGEINSVVADVDEATERVAKAFEGRPGVVVDRLDGLTISHEADAPSGEGSLPGLWWFNLRPSNTEPLLRLNSEAADPAVMAALRDEVLALVRVAERATDATG